MRQRTRQAGNAKVIVIVVILVVLAAVAVMLNMGGAPAAPGGDQIWMMDISTKQLTPAKRGTLGQVGNTVNVVVLGCGSCAEADRKIIYVERYSDTAKAALAEKANMGPDVPPNASQEVDAKIADGHEVAAWTDEGEIKWVKADSPEGQAVIGIGAPCERAITCTPGKK